MFAAVSCSASQPEKAGMKRARDEDPEEPREAVKLPDYVNESGFPEIHESNNY